MYKNSEKGAETVVQRHAHPQTQAAGTQAATGAAANPRTHHKTLHPPPALNARREMRQHAEPGLDNRAPRQRSNHGVVQTPMAHAKSSPISTGPAPSEGGEVPGPGPGHTYVD